MTFGSLIKAILPQIQRRLAGGDSMQLTPRQTVNSGRSVANCAYIHNKLFQIIYSINDLKSFIVYVFGTYWVFRKSWSLWRNIIVWHWIRWEINVKFRFLKIFLWVVKLYRQIMSHDIKNIRGRFVISSPYHHTLFRYCN